MYTLLYACKTVQGELRSEGTSRGVGRERPRAAQHPRSPLSSILFLLLPLLHEHPHGPCSLRGHRLGVAGESSVIVEQAAVGTIGDEATLLAESGVLFAVELGESPLLGDLISNKYGEGEEDMGGR